MTEIRRALVSVSDKRGVAELGRRLAALGIEILSTGGTATALREADVNVTPVAEYTGAPEILGGRVKTLHPRIHGGILARDTPEHRAELDEHGIGAIDLVVVNLYPFEQTIAKLDASLGDAVENIDIGGPCMIRAAAKNFERVAVVTEPDDYESLLEDLSKGGLSRARRMELATKAFAHTAAYDAAIVEYLSRISSDSRADSAPARDAFPGHLSLGLRRSRVLRYGENPHQQAVLYVPRSGAPRGALATAEPEQGKPLSYNNMLDIDAALGCVREFEEPTAVIVKHLNPCGVASAGSPAEAYRLARETDPTSSFGGIVAVNRSIDKGLAEQLVETFLECVVGPEISDEAREILARKKNLRVLLAGVDVPAPHWAIRSIDGGVLVQTADSERDELSGARVVSEKKPTDEELSGLLFAWRVAKHVKSNAIVFCKGRRTAAIGAGQMSRIDSVKLCQLKATMPLEGCSVASDAFFPFRDGLDALADAGATSVVQPGGSIRDQEVIDAANERGVAMLFTGTRHFRH